MKKVTRNAKAKVQVLSPVADLMHEALRLCRREKTADHRNRLAIAVARDKKGASAEELAKALDMSPAALKEEFAALGVLPGVSEAAKPEVQAPAKAKQNVYRYGTLYGTPYVPSWLRPANEQPVAQVIDEEALARVPLQPRNTGRGDVVRGV
jgi:hypothetical protein